MFGTYKVSDLTTVGAVTPLPWVIQMLALTLGLTTVFCLLMGLLFLQTGLGFLTLSEDDQLATGTGDALAFLQSRVRECHEGWVHSRACLRGLART